MDAVKIKWLDISEEKKNINQVYSKGLEFAIASGSAQCSHFIYCKDFLQDAVWANLHGKYVDIYNFNYDPKKNPVDLNDLTRVLVGNDSDEHFDRKIPDCLDFLNQIEKKLRLKRTSARPCEDPPEQYLPGGVFLFESSQRWMTSPPLMSLYTLLLRCGFVHKVGDDYEKTLSGIASGSIEPYQDNDKDFVKDSMPGISLITTLGYRKVFYVDIAKNYPPSDCDVSYLHHDCGIRSYSWGYTKKKFPHWHREELLEMLKEVGTEVENLWTVPPVTCKNSHYMELEPVTSDSAIELEPAKDSIFMPSANNYY